MIEPEVKERRKFRRLAVTLIIVFMALSASALLLSGGLQLYFNLQAQRRAVASQQRLVAEGAANKVKNFIFDKFQSLKGVAYVGSLSDPNQTRRKLDLEKLLGFEPAFRQLILLDTQGQELVRVSRVSSALPEHVILKPGGELFSRAANKNDYISQVYIDEITSEPMIVLAVPVKDIFGDFKGVFAAEVNLKFMWDLVGRIRIGERGLAYVVDKKGNLIAFSDISRVLKKENLSHLDEVSSFVGHQEEPSVPKAHISKGILGTYVIATHHHLESPDWAVVVELPVAEAYQGMIRVVQLTVLVLLFSLLVIMAAAVYISRKISGPLVTLRDAALQVGKGKLDTQIKIEASNEIGELAEAFNQMARDLQGTTTSIDNLNKEIAERREVEERLLQAEERYRMQFEGAMDAIFVADVYTGRLIDCNPAAEKLVEREKSELIGQHQRILHPPEEDEGEFRGGFRERLMDKNQKSQLAETRIVTKSGAFKDVMIATSIFKVRGKEVIQGIFHDITERRKAEKAIMDSEEKFRSLFENSQDAILLIGREKGVLDCNRAALSIFKAADKEKLMGRHLGVDFSPEKQPDGAESRVARNITIEKAFREGPQFFEWVYKRLDGSLFTAEVLLSVCRYEDQEILQAILRDISGRKKAEEELKRAYEQLKATQAQLVQSAKMASVGLLAGGVAHEINNPLTGVLNNVQLIRMIAEQKKEFSFEEFKELLVVIEESAIRCKKITQSLLDFSRASRGNFQSVSLNDIVEKIIVLIGHELNLQDVLIKKELEPALPLVLGDSQLLQQAIFDMVSNARWAIKKRSEKEPGLIAIKTQYDAGKNMACVFILDNGIGISKEGLSHVFEPFFTTKPVGEGTGLGLSIVYSIIKAHKGNVEVESEENKGTIFKICLPVAAG
jgi:PAS domain S-box-containing protein